MHLEILRIFGHINLSLYRPLGPPHDHPSLKFRISGTMQNSPKHARDTFVEDKKCNKNMSYHLVSRS